MTEDSWWAIAIAVMVLAVASCQGVTEFVHAKYSCPMQPGDKP